MIAPENSCNTAGQEIKRVLRDVYAHLEYFDASTNRLYFTDMSDQKVDMSEAAALYIGDKENGDIYYSTNGVYLLSRDTTYYLSSCGWLLTIHPKPALSVLR